MIVSKGNTHENGILHAEMFSKLYNTCARDGK
jgi:hypothetical protein